MTTLQVDIERRLARRMFDAEDSRCSDQSFGCFPQSFFHIVAET